MTASATVLTGATLVGLQFGALQNLARAATGQMEPQAASTPAQQPAAAAKAADSQTPADPASNAAPGNEPAGTPRETVTPAPLLPAIGPEAAKPADIPADGASRGQKASALPQDITAARLELFGQALDEERTRSAGLTSELAAARRDRELQTEQLREIREEVRQLRQAAADTAQTTERSIAGLRQSLQQERERADTLARDIESRQRAITMSIGPVAKPDGAGAGRVIEAVATARPPAVAAPGDPETTRLIARARALLGQGNIGAARIVLERASDAGSARASFTLAETYDPAILSTWGTYGTRGDSTRARELYAKAQAGGIQEAGNRLERLQH